MKKKNEIVQPVVSGNRFEVGFQILNQWLCLRQKGGSVTSFFKDNLIKNVAIYGMGALGERLYDELKDSEVAVLYGIDRMASSKNIYGLKIYSSCEIAFPETEVIVVTPVQDYHTIVKGLEEKTNAVIMSLEDILDYCIAER